MTNAELIAALRYHADATIHDCDGCPYQTIHKTNGMCIDSMISDAADALEAAEKRIDELERNFSDVCNANGSLACERNKLLNDVRELEAQIPKEGEWIMLDPKNGIEMCSRCRYTDYTARHSHYCPTCGARMRMRKGEQDGC